MKVEIVAEAEEELREAVAYYEEIESGLGLRFREETCTAIQWMAANPLVPRLRSKGYRRVNLRVFPYYIAYFIWEERVWILAVAHGRRRPEYWLERRK